jgi:truncated hemoglobin YjbI
MTKVADKTIDTVQESMYRCLSKPEFMDRFYEAFMSSPDIQSKFHATNMALQKIVLRSSLHLMLGVARGQPGEGMKKLAESHSRHQRDIPVPMYEKWLDAMVRAAKACDPQFSNELESMWREVMQPGIDFMTAHY